MKANATSHTGESARGQGPCRAAPANRILVVDDDLTLRLLHADVLIHSGYYVDTANDGEHGWESLQARNYDLLITDNDMPKVSGVELVKKLRAARMALPVIIATGTLPEELERHPWLQLAAMLVKPFTSDVLLGTVRKVLHADDIADGSQPFTHPDTRGAFAEGIAENKRWMTIR
jgi:two-component system, chemotaxis family, chemotaxis protein CheY